MCIIANPYSERHAIYSLRPWSSELNSFRADIGVCGASELGRAGPTCGVAAAAELERLQAAQAEYLKLRCAAPTLSVPWSYGSVPFVLCLCDLSDWYSA